MRADLYYEQSCKKSLIMSLLAKYIYNMSEHKSQSAYSANLEEISPQKSQMQLKRERRKQFQTFLNPVQNSPLQGLPKRKLSGDNKQKQEVLSICKICNCCNSSESSRECDFCKSTVCLSHLRKRRRNHQTNKFNRICDDCEDRYLIEKHLKNQLKMEESLVAQELIVKNKHQEAQEMLKNKRVRRQVQENKNRQLLDTSVKEFNLFNSLKDQIDRKTKKLEAKASQQNKLQTSLIELQKTLPLSLQADYNYLVEQDERITKDLVRYQKLCNDAVQARSVREKKMYQEYYRWQKVQRYKQDKAKDKEKECCIY